MSRAPKSRPTAARSSNQGSTLIGVFVGLVIGVLIAAVLAWYFSRPYDFQKAQSVPAANQSGTVAPIALPGKPGDKPVEKPAAQASGNATQSAPADDKKFDFYEILPKGDQAALPAAAPAKPAAAESADRFYLQLGAFSDPSEVDNLKARLALMGVEASVQRIESPEKGTLHRVRLGPYAKPEDMNAARAQLVQAGIETNIIKVKAAAPVAAQSAQ
ncbi:SPOR domain-containing protein [Niveibacterium sp. 24ML]|uniref:SPOR domain-containing protein n=1 Tax=Niveibacterium sp. 24ML TaxID=2985512 RepID=UPI002271ED38|nr:SPOR domain-containing protein [Niveibacterium sp. 24ML]MCX9157383.1 SPOR domain-containing protein [Niveibacterium sp. 24ML]